MQSTKATAAAARSMASLYAALARRALASAKFAEGMPLPFIGTPGTLHAKPSIRTRSAAIPARRGGGVAANEWTDEFMSSEDWLPTLMAAVGDTDIKERLLKGTRIGERDYKVYLDGDNQTDMLTGKGKSKRREFFFYGETEMNTVRVDQWKLHFALKNTWLGAAEKVDGGLLVNIKLDPFERTPDTGGHLPWMKEKSFQLPIVGAQLQRFGKSLQDFPPRQKGSGIGAATLLNPKKD